MSIFVDIELNNRFEPEELTKMIDCFLDEDGQQQFFKKVLKNYSAGCIDRIPEVFVDDAIKSYYAEDKKFQAANLAWNYDRYEKALEIYEELDEWESAYKVSKELDDKEKTKELLEKTLLLYERKGWCYGAADLCKELGDYERRRENLKNHIWKTFNFQESEEGLKELAIKEDLIDHYLECKKITTRYPGLFFNIAEEAKELGKPEFADGLIELGLEMLEKREAFSEIASKLYKLDRKEKAIDYYIKEAEKDKRSSNYENAAKIADEIGQKERAYELREKRIDMEEKDGDYCHALEIARRINDKEAIERLLPVGEYQVKRNAKEGYYYDAARNAKKAGLKHLCKKVALEGLCQYEKDGNYELALEVSEEAELDERSEFYRILRKMNM